MKAQGALVPRPRRGPAPSQAGTCLLIHDLKNLAGRLSALCQNLDHFYEDPLFKRSAMEVLDDTAGHLYRLAGDLRSHAGRILIKLRIDLNQVLGEAVGDSRPDLAGEVELVEEYGDLPPIWGDAYLLRRAFACAIDNALEAMNGRGMLTLRSARVRRRRGERLRIEISDSGAGMTPEFIRHWLTHPLASTKRDGLGLGVYTMRQVTALHGGTVRILSGEGIGTRVRFYFPADED